MSILIIIGLNLWPESAVDDNKQVLHHPKQRVEWTSRQSMDQRFEYLRVELGGAVTVDLKMAAVRLYHF